MEGFKRCSNGHFFKEALPECPHCPGGGKTIPGSDADKTQVGGMGATKGDFDKTQIFGQGSGQASNDDATQVFGAQSKPAGGSAPRDLDKTYIGGVTETADSGDTGTPATPRAARKITGWIISYTIDEMGVDYRIYEGKNRIGKNPASEITILADSTVSAEHAIILYRSGVWYLEDEMSANGTFLNGEELKPRNPVEIKDGDDIRLGSTIFKFKTCL
ncbi:FHA domain-containing protein [Crocinitomicaceae bacterium]|nr:FHA domain-containing protein [Crocinitomicaceae bacterium]